MTIYGEADSGSGIAQGTVPRKHSSSCGCCMCTFGGVAHPDGGSKLLVTRCGPTGLVCDCRFAVGGTAFTRATRFHNAATLPRLRLQGSDRPQAIFAQLPIMQSPNSVTIFAQRHPLASSIAHFNFASQRSSWLANACLSFEPKLAGPPVTRPPPRSSSIRFRNASRSPMFSCV